MELHLLVDCFDKRCTLLSYSVACLLVRYAILLMHFSMACARHLVALHDYLGNIASECHSRVLEGWISGDLCPSELLCLIFHWSGVT